MAFFVNEPALAQLALAGTVALADEHVLYRSIRLCPPRGHGTDREVNNIWLLFVTTEV